MLYLIKHIVESFDAHVCYTTLNLFVTFDQRKLDIQSRDLTTFQTPFEVFHLTLISMGYTNSQQIMHINIMFILKDEILDVAFSYINDVLVKELLIKYELLDNTYKTISKNLNICQFIWEHLNDVNCILQRIKVINDTFFKVKLVIVILEVVIIDHTCNYSDRVLDVDWIKIIVN